jgi:hypothetical protein
VGADCHESIVTIGPGQRSPTHDAAMMRACVRACVGACVRACACLSTSRMKLVTASRMRGTITHDAIISVIVCTQ